MKKDTFWIPHDINARNDPKSVALRFRHGAEGYGRFWMLVETLAEQPTASLPFAPYTFDGLAAQWGCTEEVAEAFIRDLVDRFQLLQSDGHAFWSDRLNRAREVRTSIATSRATAGAAGGRAKAEAAKKATPEPKPAVDRLTVDKVLESLTLSPELKTPLVVLALSKWVRHRMKGKKPADGWVAFFQAQVDNILAPLGAAGAEDALTHSTTQGYTGLHPRKSGPTSTPRRTDATNGFRSGPGI